MLNYKIIIKALGALLIIESFFLLLTFGVSLIYAEHDWSAFLISFAITLLVGIGLLLISRKAKKEIHKREGYIIVSLVWVVFSIFGALPFIISGEIPSITNAFF